MKLRRALYLFVGLSSTACSDLIPDADTPLLPFGDAAVDGKVPNAPVDAGVDGQAPIGGAVRAMRMVSMPPTYVVAGDTYRYRVKTNGSKSTALELMDAPAGMTLRGPMVEWTPTPEQVTPNKPHLVKLRATGASPATSATQELPISVARATLVADAEVSSETGGSVYGGGAPEATRLRGVGVYVPPRSVASSTRVSISELDVAPAMPNTSGTTRAVRFGPHGQLFESPARLTLPLPREVAHAPSRLGVYVYDPAGRWQRVPVVAIDTENGLVTARAQHFSVYAAIQSSLDLDVSLGLAGNRNICSGALIGRSVVTSPLSEIDLASVNNLPAALHDAVAGSGGVEASLLDLLGSPGFSGSVRTVQVLELVEAHGSTEVLRDQRTIANTLYISPEGKATVTHTDALGNVIGSQTYPTPATQVSEIAARLSGAATNATFAGVTGASLGLSARTHILYFPGDASLDPVNVEDLGIAAVERAPTFAAIEASPLDDVDCDGLLTAFDPTDDSLLAAIEASPSSVIAMYRGEDTKLEARVVRGETKTGVWSLLDGGDATLAEIAGAPNARRFSANAAGRYLVSFRATEKGRALERVFAIDVAERAQQNTAPRCQPTKALETGRIGEAVALTALASDDESAPSGLRIEWGLVAASGPSPTLDASSMLDVRGDKALFAPLSPGNYLVGCRAYDGETFGPVGVVKLPVIAAADNRAPVDFELSPIAASIEVGGLLKLQAHAIDPDGDALTFSWAVEGALIESQPTFVGDLSILRIKGDKAGIAKVSVNVTDGKAAPLKETVQVLVGSPPAGAPDQDKDGWVAGQDGLGDCNDNDATVFPGALEKCGENVDRNCDDSIRLDDCDYDDQTVAQGDCDDANPNRKLGLTESCDGIDNNCNVDIDEAFSLGKSCIVGKGTCEQRGVLVCSADAVTTICDATPLPGTPEVCDGFDNDCDGIVDPEPVCASSVPDGGTTVRDAGVPDGSVSGCVYKGPEVCNDRVDNDCDGVIDPYPYCQSNDGGTTVVVDGGVAGCVYQGAELCTDGVDNDCDGQVDLKDLDCTAPTPTADSCIDVRPIAFDEWVGGSFAGAKLDFASRCVTKPASTADRIYGFKLLEQRSVTVTYEGAAPFSWSIQEGTCNTAGAQLSELTCYDATGFAVLKPGEYFLVIRGVTGSFEVKLTSEAPR